MDLKLSPFGVGTYLGDIDQKTSEGYREVARLDNRYSFSRYMKSERDLGEAIYPMMQIQV